MMLTCRIPFRESGTVSRETALRSFSSRDAMFLPLMYCEGAYSRQIHFSFVHGNLLCVQDF